MRKSHKIITAVAVAGIVFAGGSAFTGTGLKNTEVTDQFIGGTVTQTVTGATLATVDYDFTDDTRNTVNKVALTFAAGIVGHPVAIAAAGIPDNAGDFQCEPVSATNESVCASTAGYTGLTGLNITVEPIPAG